jgi:hypothetical protein
MRYILVLFALLVIVALGTSPVAARPDSGVTQARAVVSEGPRPSVPDASDVVEIYQVQAAFHLAASTKNLDLMTSLFAKDAALSMGGHTYTGKTQVRTFFATVSGPFKPQNHWVSLTPAPKIRIEEQGDRARLYFECVYVDVVTKQIKAHLYADAILVRSDGRWLIQTMQAGPATLLEQ